MRIRRGSERGARTSARPGSRPNASRPSSSTAKFSDLFRMRGNGWTGSSPSGLSTGISSRRKWPCSHLCCFFDHFVRFRMRRPSVLSAGMSSALSTRYWAWTSSETALRMASSVAAGVRLSGPGCWAPCCSRWRIDATRTSKNSSRLVQEMHRKRTRSSSGMSGSRASSRTRRVKHSRLSSRFRYSGGASSASSSQRFSGTLCCRTRAAGPLISAVGLGSESAIQTTSENR